MVGLLIGFLILIILAVGFIWLATRAWRARNGVVRWLGVFFAGLLGLVFTAVTVLALVGVYRLNVPPYQYGNPIASIPVTGGQAQIDRGKELANGCTGCHSSTGNLPLDGSGIDFLAGGPPLGSMVPPNLTPSGPLKDWTDAQIARAIREGVDNQGHPLLIMPSDGFHAMSDEDVYSLVAYLRSQPPSTRRVPPVSLNVLGHAIIGSGLFPTSAQPPISAPVTAPPRAATAEYGKYITDGFGCESCHGVNMAGAVSGGGGPPAPNLTVIVPHWSQADFITFFRTGVAPGGVQVNPNNMPWKDYSKALTDQDLQALYLYLHALPPVNKTTP
jgi:mono/diheme cytochrome c family protein